jgi:hypothetical protein
MKDYQRINQLEEFLMDEYSTYCQSEKSQGITPMEYDDWEYGSDYLSEIKSELVKLLEVTQ